MTAWLKRLAPLVVVALGVAALPGFAHSPLYRSLMVSALLYAMMGVGMNTAFTLSGQFALMQHSSVAIGAYSTAVLVQRYHTSFLVSMLAGMAIAGVATLVITAGAARLTGVYLGLATFGFASLVATIIDRWRGMTAGPNGLTVGFNPWLGFTLRREIDYFYAALGLLVVFTAAQIILVNTRWGERTIAMRENEALASSLGIRPLPRKVAAAMIGSFGASAAGSLYAPYVKYIDPTLFRFTLLVSILTVVIVGGRRMWFGPWIGAAVLIVLPRVSTFTADYRDLAVGAITVLIIVVAPHGLGGAVSWVQRKLRKSKPAELGDDQMTAMVRVEASERATRKASSQSDRPLLELDGVSKKYGAVLAVNKVSLRLAAGQVAGMIGPNGAGKTTLFDCVVGRTPITSGKVIFDGEDVTGLAPHELARRGLRRSFQSPIIFPELTVRQAIEVACDDSASAALAEELLESFGLGRFREVTGAELPAGIAKLVGVTVAAASLPKLLLLDEPAAGLNPVERSQLVAMIGALNERGVTVWLVEHDVDLVLQVVERLSVLEQGQLIADGDPTETVGRPNVVAAYIGVPV